MISMIEQLGLTFEQLEEMTPEQTRDFRRRYPDAFTAILDELEAWWHLQEYMLNGGRLH